MNEPLKIAIRILPFVAIIFFILLNVKKGKLSSDEIGLHPPHKLQHAFLWCIGFLVFCILTELVLFRFGFLEVQHHTFKPLTSSVKLIGIILLAPVAEELLYRGLFLSKLIGFKINKHLAIGIIAILFVIMHSFVFENTLASKIGIVQTFVDATLFGYARLTTKSIYTPITMHITGNLIATAEMYLL